MMTSAACAGHFLQSLSNDLNELLIGSSQMVTKQAQKPSVASDAGGAEASSRACGVLLSVPEQREQSVSRTLESMVKRAMTSAAGPGHLSEGFAFAVCSADRGNCSVHPGEEFVLSARGYEKKKLEFALGREAARLALRQIGFESGPAVLRGSGGEPLWPIGVAGSISHCYPWSVAVVGQHSNDLAVGIDLESVDRLREIDISNLICSDKELQWVQEGEIRERLLMVFSAKEAVYKAFYPIYQRYIDFKEVELSWLSDQGCFRAKFMNPAPGFVPESFGPVCCHHEDGLIFSCLIRHLN
jgi:4'-phosphopantetheinyl transferase EntD